MDGDLLLAIAGAAGCAQAGRGRPRKPMQRVEKKPSKLGAAAEQTQHAVHNRDQAAKRDYELRARQQNTPKFQSKDVGVGKWKQRTAHEVLRIGFASPSCSINSLAKMLRPPASNRHCTDLIFTCANELVAKQESAVELCFNSATFVVVQLTFDEWKHRMLQKGPARYMSRSCDTSILACHGRCLIGRKIEEENAFTVQEEELILRPVAMKATSAAAMWSGLQASLPSSVWSMLQGIAPLSCRAVAVCTSSDRVSANVMMIQHIDNNANSAADRVFIFRGWCNQHGTGNCLQPLLRILGVIPPMFCLVRRLRSDSYHARFLQGVRVGIKLRVRWIRGCEQPTWRPRATDLAHANAVMELGYYRRDLRTSEQGEAGEQVGDDGVAQESGRRVRGEHLRRQRGAALLKRCCGDWRAADIIFWDSLDEYQHIDEVVEEIAKLILLVGFHHLEEPSDNKWLSVWPVNSAIYMMMSFHCLFIFALRYACKVEGDEEEQLARALVFDEGELVGSTSSEAWHRMERRRELKALAWAERESSFLAVALFAYVADYAMRLHYTFFRYGKIQDSVTTNNLLYKLCDETSPAQQMIARLWDLLKEAPSWGVLEMQFGPFSSWSPARRSLAKTTVVSLIGELERRLVAPFRQAPFSHWVPLANPEKTGDEKLTVARALFDAPEATLDANSLRLRRSVGSPESLVDDPFWQTFIYHCMKLVGLSSSFVECLFAHYRQWMAPSSRPLSMELLGAKHMAHEMVAAGVRNASGLAAPTCQP
jgi:hypothetical protein